jgi:hypothetical protein
VYCIDKLFLSLLKQTTAIEQYGVAYHVSVEIPSSSIGRGSIFREILERCMPRLEFRVGQSHLERETTTSL